MWNRTASSPALPAGLRPVIELGLPALAVLFGLQALRAVLPGVVWVLADTMAWNRALVTFLTILLFLTPLLTGRLEPLLGRRRLLLVTAAGLGLLRLLMQLWSQTPIAALALAMACLVFFFLFLPTYVRGLGASRRSAGRFALGLLLGLTLDTALHGAFHTYDPGWQSGPVPLVATVLPVLAMWTLVAVLARHGERDAAAADTHEPVSAAALVALGPFLFLQIVVLQNIARAATLTGWTLPQAFGWTLLAHLAGLAAAVWLLSGARGRPWLLALICGVALIAALSTPYPEGPFPAAAALLAGQVLSSILIVLAFASAVKLIPSTRHLAWPIAGVATTASLLVLLMGYYFVYNFSLPYSNTLLEPFAAFLLGTLVLRACFRRGEAPAVGRGAWLVVLLGLPLLALPLAQAVNWQSPAAVEGQGFPVRIVTYNVHNGFDTEGRLGMEAIAAVIDELDPDILALQEISRGWVISGRLDMLSWFSNRLDMPYVSGPTADPLWGNAILSRYPMVDYTEHDLPPRDLPVKRGLLEALVDLGNGDSLLVIDTHFHHIVGDSAIRQIQARRAVEVWGGRDRTVLLGDFNARPGDPEIDIIRQAGLLDAAAGIVSANGYTWPSDAIAMRIDYIWVSPDLKASNVRIVASTASDHLPVVADIGP